MLNVLITIVSEGYLYKMAISSSNQAWRRRYFVLSANGLFAYYASKTATAPKGVIMLSPDFYVADSLNRQFGFQLSDFTQTFYMAAECTARGTALCVAAAPLEKISCVVCYM